MKTIKLAGAIIETILAIPIVGWFLYIYSFGILAVTEITLGILGLVYYKKEKNLGSILQIIAGACGWIPIAGLILHILSAVNLYMEALK